MAKVPIEVSARHVHISENDLKEIFGEDHKLLMRKKISQADEYASEDVVIIKSESGSIKNVRIVGPTRSHTQVEITKTDAYLLKINPPVKECTSCTGEEAEEIEIIGPKGSIKRNAAIIAHRHIHLSPSEANELNLKNGDLISVKVSGERAITFHDVLIRVKEGFVKNMHLDTDEANAAGVEEKEEGEIII